MIKKINPVFLITLMFLMIFSFFAASCSDGKIPISPENTYEIDLTSCTSCGKCSEVCPYNAIDNSGDKPVIIQSKCVGCGKCADICPENAIN